MNYRAYIEDNFLIDEPQLGKLVPFKFNKVQNEYYNILKKLGIEQGITIAIREFIVKARREGFSSFILALFAADDLTTANPTESMVISYKDDATNTFRKRYRRYILSCAAKKAGESIEDIQNDPNVLEKYRKDVFSVDANELELRHNRAHFYCGTAAARTGGRGGVLQKLLFTEPAHYQDTEKITATEIVEGTMQQVDKNSGWIFQESTANGVGNFFHTTYELITKGLSRFILRFFGWRSFYTEEQFELIKSEFVDPDMLKQEYPETVTEAFLSSNLSFTNREEILALVGIEAEKKIKDIVELAGVNYIDQCETILDYLVTLERLNPNKNFYVGIDTAKSIDRTTVYILEEAELSAGGGVQCIAIDSTGQGDFVPDWFEKSSRWHIHRVKFSRASKSLMYKNLQTVIKGKLTRLPEFIFNAREFISDEWQNFFKQMIYLQKEIIGELLVVAHPSGTCDNKGSHDYDNCKFHDDHPDGWTLAEIAWIVMKGVPEGSKPPREESTTKNAVRRLLDNKKKGHGDGKENYD